MWHSKKKKEPTLPFEKNIEIEFTTAWAPNKKEVVIMTNNGPITLNEKSEFFVEVTINDINTVKVQIIPDFENRKLNFVEVIEPTNDKNKGNIVFAGVRTVRKTPLSIDEYLKKWDESIEDIGKKLKKYEKRKYILTILLAILASLNIYLFFINGWILRYINIFAVVISIYTLYNLWKSTKKMYEDYEELKKLREEAFEVVKEK